MKFKSIAVAALAFVAFGANAQTHVEGMEYYRADQLDNARELLLRSLDNPGTDKSVSDYYLGMIAYRNGNLAESAKYFGNGVAANPENGYNYVGQGLLKLKAGDAKAAEALFKEAQKHSKKDAGLEIAIARAYDSVDPVAYQKQIEKQVQKARKANMKSPEIYLFEGDQQRENAYALDKNDLDRNKVIGNAASMYEMASGYANNDAAAYVKYANLYRDVNPTFAIQMLQKLLDVNPSSALGQRELANAYYMKKDYANATRQYAAYVNNPSHFKSDENRYAFLLFYSQDYKKGYDYATELLKEDPANFTAQRYQFMNAAQIKDMDSQLLPMAEALYAAHKANPKANKLAPIDYTLISDELSRHDRVDEAVAVLEGAIKEDPQNANFSKQLSDMYVNASNLSKATDAFMDYMKKIEEPGYNDFNQLAVYAYFAGRQNIINNPAESKRYFGIATENAKKAAEIAPEKYKPVKVLGDIAIASAATDADRVSAGVPDYTKAIALLEASGDPSQFNSQYLRDGKEMYNYLGNYYLNQKDDAKAKQYFQKSLNLDPNDEQVRKVINSL